MPPTPMPTRSHAMSPSRSPASSKAACWRTWSTASADTDAVVPANAGTTRLLPQHQVERALDDCLQLLPGGPRPGADRDRMDGSGGKLRQHDRIGALGQFAGLLGAAEAEGECLVELGQRVLHH